MKTISLLDFFKMEEQNCTIRNRSIKIIILSK